jgi:hypothetical protein
MKEWKSGRIRVKKYSWALLNIPLFHSFNIP